MWTGSVSCIYDSNENVELDKMAYEGRWHGLDEALHVSLAHIQNLQFIAMQTTKRIRFLIFLR